MLFIHDHRAVMPKFLFKSKKKHKDKHGNLIINQFIYKLISEQKMFFGYLSILKSNFNIKKMQEYFII